MDIIDKMKTIKKIILLLSIMGLMLWGLNLLYPLDRARLHKPASRVIYDRNHQRLSIKLSSDGYLRIPIKPHEITPTIKKILYGYVDKYFEQHWGVNPLSIVRAIYANLWHRQHLGASTLTMQVIRMMHHKPRTLRQKIIEIFQAFQLEWYYSKSEILTLYLNNAPYGGNVEGLASASFRYFGLPPTSLSTAQIAYLISIPKNPNHHAPKKGRDINAIKNRLLERLYQLNWIDAPTYHQATQEHIHATIHPLPNEIPHLAVHITTAGEVNTTIDHTIQTHLQQRIAQQVKRLHKFGIYNGAAIVIDNRRMEILAYVGSHDFGDKRHGGENDGIIAPISPGSTLKPLVYARALEEGLITPLKLLYDVPLFIHGYKPTNYSKNYLGEVTASEALQRSLNIPAVDLNRLLKNRGLYELLHATHIDSLRHKKHHYGSALVLGGWGLSLRENAELFAMLSNGGVFQPSHYLLNQPPSPAIPLLRPQATYLISNILANAPRPDFSTSWEFIQGIPKVAFKTGTSAHAKDILTLGYTPEYTVGVWFGNFSGRPSHPYHHQYATGFNGAATTLLQIFQDLGAKEWFTKPQGIQTQSICQDAILLGDCQKHIQDEVIVGVTPHTPCLALRAEILTYLIDQQTIHSIRDLQTHRCYAQWQSYPPLITNPIHNQTYIHNRQLPQSLNKTMLQCYAFETNSTIYWLIDQHPPILSQSGRKIYRYLSAGQHTLSCIDEGAKRQNITINIKEI